MNHYAGKILMVDLTQSRIEQHPIEVPAMEKLIGGMGMNLKLMLENSRRGCAALSAENAVVLGTGPLVGIPVPSASKVFATTKFPLNNCIGTGAAGMNFGRMLRRAGFDHVVITGRSEKPVVLALTNETVELRPAQDLWGQDIACTTQALQGDLQGKSGSVMAIGPAGENGVSFSMMLVDNIATLGKGGLASVLGSKNLKGIVASGDKVIKVADEKRLKEIIRPILSAMRNSPKREILMKYGSMAGWAQRAEVAGIPYKDWTEIFPRGPLREAFGPEAYLQKVDKKRIACPSCPLPCKERYQFSDEENRKAFTFASSFIGRVTAFAVRGGVKSIRELLICHDLCNRLGLDTYSTGAAIDYAVKLYEDGLLKKSDAGFALKRDFPTTQRLIRLIANCEGVGALLAGGFADMGKNFGREFEAHIKGMDFIFDARCHRLGTYEFEQIVNPRGGHQHAGGSPTYGARNFPVSSMKEFAQAIAVPALSMEKVFTDQDFNVARLTKHCEEWYSVFSLLGICSRKNIKGYYSMESLADILSSVTGFAMNAQGLKQAGERAWNLLKLLNVGEGFTREKDRAPRNWFKPLKDGDQDLVLQDYYGKVLIGPKDLELLLDDYYDEHGWCVQHGVPTRKKIAELGLNSEWEELKAQRCIPPGPCHLD